MYDQVLGDLPQGNGDPRLTLFPRPVSPNFHALATLFVTLDNDYSAGESSGTGWNWSTQSRTTDFIEKFQGSAAPSISACPKRVPIPRSSMSG